MPLYTQDTFDKSLIPNNLKHDVREQIAVAVMLGWNFHRTTTNGCTLIAPGDPCPKKIHFGVTRATRSPRHFIRDIVKYADPGLLQVVLNAKDLPDSWINALPDVESVGVDDRPLPDETPSHRAPARTSEPEQEVHTVKPESKAKEAKPTIVSEEPMLAKAGEGQGYLSPTTIQRKWSDGTTDYTCANGCGYDSPHRTSVSRHYGATHGRETATPARHRFAAEVPDAQTYAPRQSRVEALAEALQRAFNAGEEPDFGALAKTALTWVHEQSRSGSDLSGEREPMTDADMLNRIRTLLDQGQYVNLQQQVTASEETIARLQTEMEEIKVDYKNRIDAADEYAAECLARAERAQGNLAALGELLTEMGQSDAAEKAVS